MQERIIIPFFILLLFSTLGLFFLSITSYLLLQTHISNVLFLKLSLLIQSISVFAIPAIISAKICFKNPINFLKIKRLNLWYVFLATCLIIFLIPFIAKLSELNENIHLPRFLSNYEVWIREKEASLEILTQQILNTTTPLVLILNIVVVGIAPAISEELFFRGFIQRILEKKLNYHIAIWITAFIFSAIHFQFLGFIPRMLLGAIFGYLVVWSGSLLLPIIAHFINNAIGVISYYIRHNKIIDLNAEHFSWATVAISVFLSSIILFVIYKRGKHYR